MAVAGFPCGPQEAVRYKFLFCRPSQASSLPRGAGDVSRAGRGPHRAPRTASRCRPRGSGLVEGASRFRIREVWVDPSFWACLVCGADQPGLPRGLVCASHQDTPRQSKPGPGQTRPPPPPTTHPPAGLGPSSRGAREASGVFSSPVRARGPGPGVAQAPKVRVGGLATLLPSARVCHKRQKSDRPDRTSCLF